MQHSNLVVEILRNPWFNFFLLGLGGIAIVFCIRRYIKKGESAYRYYATFFSGLTLIVILQFFQRSFPRSSFPGILISFLIAIIFIISILYFYLGFKKEKTKQN